MTPIYKRKAKDKTMNTPYQAAQHAMAELKGAIYETLLVNSTKGMTNAELGRALGIYAGHVGHEGHISRTLLSLMESEGVVEQDDESKKWKVRNQVCEETV